MNNVVLFVTHRSKQCGVYEFGKSIFNAISASEKYNFIKAECDSLEELKAAIDKNNPIVIIYNYHPSVMPWICTKIAKGMYQNNISSINALQLGIVHEITQEVADTATAYRNKIILGGSQKKLNSLFDYYIAADPTLLLKNPFVYKTGRLIAHYKNDIASPAVTTIGSFGFATPKKGFESLVRKVQEEFDEAVIRINMPAASFGDADGKLAKAVEDNCAKIITKPGIKLEVSHDYLTENNLLDFLAGNSMNVFMYEDKTGRGISSAVDNALAVKKPIAISRCLMFRHILDAQPSICVEDLSLKEILKNGFAPLENISKDWDAENLCWEYKRILDSVIQKNENPASQKFGIIRKLKQVRNKFFTLPNVSFTWLRNTDAANDDDLTSDKSLAYTALALNGHNNFNRILDDKARDLYEPAIIKLFELAPSTMSKKIARANVQQAFVFDTAFRFLKDYPSPKLLCVGSYEDTASMGLRKMGYNVDEVDPMINYFLQEFYTKPTTKKSFYDIVFSTSVIEHDPDDQSFIECIEGLLALNGIAVITCDYKDGWKHGELKPDVDARFYTKEDLENRLLSYLKNSTLLDEPNWNCINPDFLFEGKYQYTFATFCFQKKK
jgi:SAM-dependent methyltransferase